MALYLDPRGLIAFFRDCSCIYVTNGLDNEDWVPKGISYPHILVTHPLFPHFGGIKLLLN